MLKSLAIGAFIAAVVIIGSLFVPVCALAHAEQCPVQVSPVQDPAKGDMYIVLRNASYSPVKGVIFGVEAKDMQGNVVPFDPSFKPKYTATEQTYKSKGFVEGDTTDMVKYKMIDGGQPRGGSLSVFVKSVQFKNGSVWTDDGSHACKGEHP